MDPQNPTDQSAEEAYEYHAKKSKEAWDQKDFGLAASHFAKARTAVEESDEHLRCIQLPDGTLEVITADELKLFGTNKEGEFLATIVKRREESEKTAT